MFRQMLVVLALGTTWAVAAPAAQTKGAGVAKPVTYDVTIVADGTSYTGQLELGVACGKVSGSMRIKNPTEITGTVAGTVKAGEMTLDFPYQMVQRNCTGQIEMTFKAPAKQGGTKGTVSIAGCGRDASNKLPGTIELKPAK